VSPENGRDSDGQISASKKFNVIAFAFFGGVIAFLQWQQIVYRLNLFYTDYRGERYVNHIDDVVFPMIHFVNAGLLVASAWTLRRNWRSSGGWIWFACAVAAANVIAWASFIYMHRAGILIGYNEFIGHMKRGPAP